VPGDLYVAFHARRYAYVLQLLASYITRAECRVLDIGRSTLTGLIARTFCVRVDSLGFPTDQESDTGRHYRFDLNDTQERTRWRCDLGQFEVIVMAEVLEHLHTSPIHVLAFLKTLLAPQGVLIIQTPNAAALHKRLKLLVGRHPYELIRENGSDPGHLREYTKSELYRYADRSGLVVERCHYENYFEYRFTPHGDVPILGLLNLAYAILPPSLKPCLTMVLRFAP